MKEQLPVVLSASEIEKVVTRLAEEINRDYGGEKIVVVGVLIGAFLFAGDLVRRLTCVSEFDFMWLSSYGGGTESSGTVEVIYHTSLDLKDRHVLVVEDIVDTGHTLQKIQSLLLPRHPRSLNAVSLLSKPSRRKVAVPVQYVGKEIEDIFVVGYGMDYAGRFRNLPYIANFDSYFDFTVA